MRAHPVVVSRLESTPVRSRHPCYPLYVTSTSEGPLDDAPPPESEAYWAPTLLEYIQHTPPPTLMYAIQHLLALGGGTALIVHFGAFPAESSPELRSYDLG